MMEDLNKKRSSLVEELQDVHKILRKLGGNRIGCHKWIIAKQQESTITKQIVQINRELAKLGKYEYRLLG